MIYICIPTHNEQQTVGVVLWKLRQVLTDYPRDYQLLVADDASTDKTAAVLEPYTRVLPLTVIHSQKRLGAAASTELLLREAVRRSEYPKRDVIVTLQADFSEEPDDLVALIKRMEAGADVAIGNKVSISKSTRTHRWARKLADFFTRGQKWPEGVSTPFEGYRAYRLHAIKNALDAVPGKRLIRYAGWAGPAELLRAVMPHARRVDVIDVENRLDRMQRARRERPFACAFEVRAMMAGREPPGLVSVEELDRLAATGSRSRERGSLVAEAANGRAAAARSASRPRDHRSSGRDRERGRPQPVEQKGRGRRPDPSPVETRAQQPRTQKAAAAAPDARPQSQARGRGRNRQNPAAQPEAVEQPRHQPKAVEAAAEADPGLVPTAEAGVPKAKRKRRRRKRGGGGQAAQTSPIEQGAGASVESTGDAPSTEVDIDGGGESPADGASEVAGEKKRRRRGGRRGGRGRRRGPRPEGSEGSESGGTAGSVESGGEQSSPPAGADQEN